MQIKLLVTEGIVLILFAAEKGGKLFDEGRYADAEAAYREAIRLNPNEMAFHYNLGHGWGQDS